MISIKQNLELPEPRVTVWATYNKDPRFSITGRISRDMSRYSKSGRLYKYRPRRYYEYRERVNGHIQIWRETRNEIIFISTGSSLGKEIIAAFAKIKAKMNRPPLEVVTEACSLGVVDGLAKVECGQIREQDLFDFFDDVNVVDEALWLPGYQIWNFNQFFFRKETRQ